MAGLGNVQMVAADGVFMQFECLYCMFYHVHVYLHIKFVFPHIK